MRYRTFEIPYEGTVYDVQIAYDYGKDEVCIEEVRPHAYRPDVSPIMNACIKAWMLNKAEYLLRQPVLHEQETMDREGE